MRMHFLFLVAEAKTVFFFVEYYGKENEYYEYFKWNKISNKSVGIKMQTTIKWLHCIKTFWFGLSNEGEETNTHEGSIES